MKVSGTTFLTVDKHCEHKTAKRLIFPVIMKLDEVYISVGNTQSKISAAVRKTKTKIDRASQLIFSMIVASFFDTCGTLKVTDGLLGNATICGMSEKCCLYALFTLSTKSHTFNRFCTIHVMTLLCA